MHFMELHRNAGLVSQCYKAQYRVSVSRTQITQDPGQQSQAGITKYLQS